MLLFSGIFYVVLWTMKLVVINVWHFCLFSCFLLISRKGERETKSLDIVAREKNSLCQKMSQKISNVFWKPIESLSKSFSSEDPTRTVSFSARKLKLVANDSEIKENKIILMSPGLLNVFCSGGQMISNRVLLVR